MSTLRSSRLLLRLVGAFAVFFLACNGELLSDRSESLLTEMRMEDLETSASGYAYNEQQGLPVSYVRYTNHGSGGYYDAPVAPFNLVPQIVSHSTFKIHPHASSMKQVEPIVYPSAAQPSEYLVAFTPTSKVPPRAPYFLPNLHEKTDNVEETPKRRTIDENHADDVKEGEDSIDANSSSHENQDSSFDEETGLKFDNQENSSTGERSDRGYRNHEEFDKGDREEYAGDKETGHYSSVTGAEKSYTDSAGRSGEFHEMENHEEGNSRGSQSYHKKGEKIKGYHNVYHKDEYKKDTTFYDEGGKEGSYERYSSADAYHGSQDGKYKKQGRHNSDFNKVENGKSGQYDNGRSEAHQLAHDNQEGKTAHYENYQDHALNDKVNKANKHYDYSKTEKHL